MSPSEIRDATVSELRAARRKMLSAEWTLSLEAQDKKTQESAAKEFLRVHHAIQKLENEELAKIRDDLIQNETALAQGRARLAEALKKLNRTKSVLQAVSGLLDIIARVTPLLL